MTFGQLFVISFSILIFVALIWLFLVWASSVNTDEQPTLEKEALNTNNAKRHTPFEFVPWTGDTPSDFAISTMHHQARKTRDY